MRLQTPSQSTIQAYRRTPIKKGKQRNTEIGREYKSYHTMSHSQTEN